MKIFDAHVHYAASQGTELFLRVLDQQQIDSCVLACIEQAGGHDTTREALALQAAHPGRFHVMGGLRQSAYFQYAGDPAGLGRSLTEQVQALLDAGCDGIKMLEGKPDIRKKTPIPDFDTEAWLPFWERMSQEQIPVLWHVNDPADFWDAEKINPYARSRGWFYGPEIIGNQEQYRQVEAVLNRFPTLRIQFAHMLFLTDDLPRLSQWMRRFPNICVDLTPAVEIYLDLSKRLEEARSFFEEFGSRILLGTDIGSRSCIADPPRPIDAQESEARLALILPFLQTPYREPYLLVPDGKYLYHIDPTEMRGLGLSESQLQKICGENARRFYGETGFRPGETPQTKA